MHQHPLDLLPQYPIVQVQSIFWPGVAAPPHPQVSLTLLLGQMHRFKSALYVVNVPRIQWPDCSVLSFSRSQVDAAPHPEVDLALAVGQLLI